MSSDLLQTILSNIWVTFLVVLLFGGSIFVHELGHFLAARRRGVHVERFSIGFGPAIWSWRGKDGVEYRLSWIPLGGYVLLPQLADLGAIEGESRVEARKLPPVSYSTKMIVFAAGAAFNILFAFLLACIIWIVGRPVPATLSSTTVAEVLPTIRTSDGHRVKSPAAEAGLQPGDEITAIDGKPVNSFSDIVENLALGSGWNDGKRHTVFTIRRGEQTLDLSIQPIIGGDEKLRMVGFRPVEKLIVGRTVPGSLAEQAGLLPDDEIKLVNGRPALNQNILGEALLSEGTGPVQLTVLRSGAERTLSFARPDPAKNGADLGFTLKNRFIVTHPSPIDQVVEPFLKTFQHLWALINPKSDIGVVHLSGPIGIINSFVDVSRAGLPVALWFTIIVNVNLAILNLMPIPVLDGGQMLFATIARLRRKALPTNFVMAAQSVFFVLILAMIGYISFFGDIPRMIRENRLERAAAEKKD